MHFYNDLTPLTAILFGVAFLALLGAVIIDHTGVPTPQRHRIAMALWALTMAVLAVIVLLSWTVWSALLGPALAATPLVMLAALLAYAVVRKARRRRAAGVQEDVR